MRKIRDLFKLPKCMRKIRGTQDPHLFSRNSEIIDCRFSFFDYLNDMILIPTDRFLLFLQLSVCSINLNNLSLFPSNREDVLYLPSLLSVILFMYIPSPEVGKIVVLDQNTFCYKKVPIPTPLPKLYFDKVKSSSP